MVIKKSDGELKPVDGIVVNLPLMVTIAASAITGSAWLAWLLSGLANDLGRRIERVELTLQNSTDTLSSRLQGLTSAVDLGVSTFQAQSWIELFRARLQAIEPKLVSTVPDLPARERK